MNEEERKGLEVNEKLDLTLKVLGGHSKNHGSDGQILAIHGKKLDEHSELLGALIHDQQEIKADLDGFKLETFKRLDDVWIHSSHSRTS